MIELGFDLGDAPSVLAELADPKMRGLVVAAGAETYVSEIHDWIDEGKAFTPREGQLQNSVNWRPDGSEAVEIYANAEYAPFVEFGTEAHVIEPTAGRKRLKIPSSGNGFFFAQRVNHPGSKAHPFFFADLSQRGQAMQESMLSVLATKAGL